MRESIDHFEINAGRFKAVAKGRFAISALCFIIILWLLGKDVIFHFLV